MTDRAQRETPRRWRPILDGELRDKAMESVAAIASDLEQRSSSEGVPSATQLAEEAMLQAYLGFAQLGDRHFELSVNLLENALDAAARVPMRPSLYGGFVGVAWIIDHLQNHELNAPGDQTGEDFDPNEQVDTALREYLIAPTWSGSYDLISGLVGIGVLAADRLPSSRARECLELVVDHLARLARPMDVGVAWWTPPEQMIPATRQRYPQGYANLGVAHGVPAVVTLLAQAGAEGIAPEKTSSLLSESLRWLIAQKLPSSSESLFGYNYSPGADTPPSRSAWCYGDPGIAAALYCAARWTSEPDLEKEARETATHSLRRAPQTAGVVDAPLCHGAAGLGHLYNRIYQGTGDPAFMEAARFWFARALEMRRIGEGIGGYTSWHPGKGGWVAERGFLAGASGIALAFLSACTPVEPGWDRLLLASIQPVDF